MPILDTTLSNAVTTIVSASAVTVRPGTSTALLIAEKTRKTFLVAFAPVPQEELVLKTTVRIRPVARCEQRVTLVTLVLSGLEARPTNRPSTKTTILPALCSSLGKTSYVRLGVVRDAISFPTGCQALLWTLVTPHVPLLSATAFALLSRSNNHERNVRDKELGIGHMDATRLTRM